MMLPPNEGPADTNNIDELIEEERLVYLAAEMLSRAMEARDVNRATLATRLGKSKPFVTQLLNGGRNLTLRTLARVAFALGYRLRITLEPIGGFRLDGVTTEQSKPPRIISWVSRCEHQPPLEHTDTNRLRAAGESDDSLAA